MSRLLDQESDWRQRIESRAHGTKLWVPRGSDPKRWVTGGKTRADEPVRHRSRIVAALQRCSQLLELTEDWDDAGASAVFPSAVEAAIRLLKAADAALLERYNRTISPPTVSPCSDGSVDLFWKTDKYRLLVNIQPEPSLSDFYGETISGLTVKGTFPASASEALILPVLLELFSST